MAKREPQFAVALNVAGQEHAFSLSLSTILALVGGVTGALELLRPLLAGYLANTLKNLNSAAAKRTIAIVRQLSALFGEFLAKVDAKPGTTASRKR